MAVEHGYVLTDSDYPTVPAKTGYSGAWEKYTEPVTRDVTVEAVYTINQYTVTFVADGTTVNTITVDYGYVLKDSDYPEIPEKVGHTGAWNTYTEPVTQDTTVEATYTINQYTVTFVADGTTVKTMTVEHGYVLQDSDYPEIPEKTGYTGTWEQYPGGITQDTTVNATYTVRQYTVTFTADGAAVKLMTVEHGYVLQESDYPTIPEKTGYTGAWDKLAEPVTQDVTVEATYTINQYTVTFAADGTTLKTLTVDYGYVLTDSDYPAIPEKAGYVGTWSAYTEQITQDVTVEAVYTPSQHTVTFTADGATVKTMTVEHGYVLTDSDYPTVPAKTGYSGAWEKYTEPVTQDVTVEAVYTINKYTVKFVANGITVKNMTVNYGYVLKTSDYPVVPVVSGKTGEWIRYTRPITRNTTITARYSDAGINPPVKPPIETSSIDGATTSGNSTVKETVTAHHTYIYTGGQLAQETVTTTIAPVDGTVASATDTISATTSGTISATASDSVAAIASNTATTTETLYYAYDANGVPMSLTYTDTDGTTTTYYYATNIQGDVTAILDTTGTPVVEYAYDAWGNLLTTTGTLADTLGKANSLRYRSYIYDTETKLYYVFSRYYFSEVGRFISPDTTDILTATPMGLTDKNLYAYCDNNPITRADSGGQFWHIIVGAAVGIATQYISDVITNVAEGKSFSEALKPTSTWADYGSAALSGALAASGVGLGTSVVANAALGGATYLTNCAIKGEDANITDFGLATGVGAVAGLVGGSGADGAKLRGIASRSRQILKTAISPKKIAMYTAKLDSIQRIVIYSALRTVGAGLIANSLNYGRKLLTHSSA